MMRHSIRGSVNSKNPGVTKQAKGDYAQIAEERCSELKLFAAHQI
jgi:hypothetical protein